MTIGYSIPILVDVLIGFLAFIALQAGYDAFKLQWPSNYSSLSDTFALAITARWWRLFVFRFVPVFLVGVLASTLSLRFAGTGWLAVSVATAAHVLRTNVIAFNRSMTIGTKQSQVNYGSYHATAALVAVAGGVVASLAAPHISSVVPDNRTLLDSVWTAGLVAVVVGLILRVSQPRNDPQDSEATSYRRERALSDAGIETFDSFFSVAVATHTDPMLIQAVAINEIMQRPRWVRRIERQVGRFKKGGSYGVMQIRAESPLTDYDSIVFFAQKYTGIRFFSVSEKKQAAAEENLLWGVGGRHNGDHDFINATQRNYGVLLHEVNWLYATAGVGFIGLIELRRYATEWGVRIASSCDSFAIRLPGDELRDNFTRPSSLTKKQVWYVECRVPIEAAAVFIREPHHGEEFKVALNVTADHRSSLYS